MSVPQRAVRHLRAPVSPGGPVKDGHGTGSQAADPGH